MTNTSQNLLSFVRTIVGAWRDDPREDAELLARFVEHHDEEAFRALVWRHGQLVWRACVRVVGDGPDAEDAFQATFLALARNAGKPRGNTLAGWLHRVARQTALKVDIGARRRRGLEQRLRAVAQPALAGDADRAALYAALDEELMGLPERLRVPLLLHYLEGRSQVEVARLLGCGRSVLQRRLMRGEAILRERLERRGLTVGVGSVAVLLGSTAGAPAVPAHLIGSATRGALRSLSFPPLESSKVAALAEEVMKTMWMTKVKIVTVLLGATLCLGGGGMLAYQALAGNAMDPLQSAVQSRGEAEALHQAGAGNRAAVRVDCHGDPLPEGALARLGTVRLRHPGRVHSVTFSPDGKTVVSGGNDGTVRLWEVATGKEIRTLRGHQGEVRSVAFSSDGKTLVSGGDDGTVRLWEAATGKEIRTLRGHEGSVRSVTFSFDNKTVASGGDRTVRLWETTIGKEVRTLRGHGGQVQSVAFSPDGRTLISSGGDDSTVRLWDAATGREIRTLRGNQQRIRSVAFSSDGKILASGRDNTVHLWEMSTGKEIRILKGHRAGVVLSVTFSSDGKTMASGGEDSTVRLWEVNTGKLIRTLKGNGGFFDSVAFSSDGKTVASGGENGMRLWEVSTGKEVRFLRGHQGPVLSVAFASDGKTVASGGMWGSVRLWEVATGEEIHTLRGHEKGVMSVAFSSDSKTVASGGWDHTVRLWEVTTGKEICVLRGHQGSVFSVAFSSDGRTMASGGGYNTVRLWKVATGTGKELFHTLGRSGAVCFVAFSSDGRTLASGGQDSTVCLWETAPGKMIRTLKGCQGRLVFSAAFSSDGKIVASGGEDGVRLWEAATGKEVRTLQKKVSRSVAFAPNGRTVAVASGNQVRLWDLLSGVELPPRIGHRGEVLAVAFSPDSRALVSVSEDNTGLVWDLTYGAARPAIQSAPVALRAPWADLASLDAAQAWRAVWTMAATPSQSVPLLRDRMRPVPADRGKRLARLVADLDADEFPVRQRAYRELKELGLDAEPALRKGLEGSPSVEVRRRLEQLLEPLEKQNQGGFSGDVLRGLRAVAVLELVGTAEARQVLKTLAAGALGFRLTQEAQGALDRLNRMRAGGRSRPGVWEGTGRTQKGVNGGFKTSH